MDWGSRTSKWVLMNDKEIVDYSVQAAVPGKIQDFIKSLPDASIVGLTGYGRHRLKDFIPRGNVITEITAHATGAIMMAPETRCLLDIGGQDSKAICMNGKGHVLDFRLNDRCAAGTGRFLENMAHILGRNINELITLAQNEEKGVPISSVCAVFAESEVISLLNDGINEGKIARGVFNSMTAKIAPLLGALPSTEKIAFSGGIASLEGTASLLSESLPCSLVTLPFPQLIGAIGAAVKALNVADKEEY
ncbi:MAG: acyl-CoA dehydratase activase [Aminobacterium sp.]|uniref:acyl-CoA dehydratase activase n=1 Tax=Aminobacterium sp. TaxID=1872491 RepID=UPI002A350A8D|nr:acyl-CoA dehydratase activase [Aminobacterium sp.]MDD2207260.1 acyl-CoA dehydratase activase [Aminobacterium sp.]MDD3425258.1 acyl-CoA dehydratase activase [Aminobacterium sp.]MDD3707777.1 acyl-CoA dehydratase activase [Aminobacterium sp.]MDD4229170.1 acyl-CoA dehydratase activase [Aminobacterium sp.]MDD4552035.1 acyl-CoA dehydratase activase [Aminobacterium sp.]